MVDIHCHILPGIDDGPDTWETTAAMCRDFHLSPLNLEDAMNDPRQFAIGDTQYLMIEFDHHSIPANAGEQLLAILSRGMVPIITHPERNAFLMKNLDTVERFVQEGCLLQVTANALTGFWGPTSKQAAEELVQKKMVHIVATDAHDLELRPPVLSQAREAVSSLAGPKIAEALFVNNPTAVVSGRSIA